jgi:hypothetical protein
MLAVILAVLSAQKSRDAHVAQLGAGFRFELLLAFIRVGNFLELCGQFLTLCRRQGTRNWGLLAAHVRRGPYV